MKGKVRSTAIAYHTQFCYCKMLLFCVQESAEFDIILNCGKVNYVEQLFRRSLGSIILKILCLTELDHIR